MCDCDYPDAPGPWGRDKGRGWKGAGEEKGKRGREGKFEFHANFASHLPAS